MNITPQEAFRMISWWTNENQTLLTEGISNEDKTLLRSLMECLNGCHDVWYVNTAIEDEVITYHNLYYDFSRHLYPYLWSDDELTPDYLNEFYNGQPLL